MWCVSMWCVLMVAYMSPGCSGKRFGTNEHKEIVRDIMPQVLAKYEVTGQYSMAISVPFDVNNNGAAPRLEKVFEADEPAKVLESLKRNEVYIGTYMIAAKVIHGGGEHSEHRVLEAKTPGNNPVYAIETLKRETATSRMVFYTLNSPCYEKCATSDNNYGILKRIKDIRNKFKAFYLVFKQAFLPSVYEGKDSEDLKDQRKTALERMAGALGQTTDQGMGKIFRCPSQNFPCYCCKDKIADCVGVHRPSN